MATNLAELVVKLTAESAKYQAELEKANRTLSGFEKRQKATLSSIKNSFQALGGVYAITKVASFVQQQIEVADAIGETAAQAGVSATQLQTLQVAFGKLTQASSGQIVKGLSTFNDRLGQARNGSEELRKAFSDVGVSLDQETGPALEQVLQYLGTIENDADRAAKAGELFGTRFGPMVAAAVKGGTAALEQLRKEAIDTGQVLSDEMVQQASDLNDKFEDIKRTITVESARAILENAEAVDLLATAIGRAVAASVRGVSAVTNFTKWLGEEFAARIHGIAVDDLPRLQQELDRARKFLETLEKSNSSEKFLERQRQIIAALEARVELAERLNRIESEGEADRKSGAQTTPPPALAKAEDLFPDVSPETTRNWFQVLEELEQREQQYTEKIVGWAYQRRAAEEEGAAEILQARQDALESLVEMLGTEEEKIILSYQRRLNMILENTEAGSEIQEELLRRLGEKTAEELQRIADETEKSANIMTVAMEEAARNIQDALADFLFDPFQDGLDGMLMGFLDTLRRMAAEAAASGILKAIGQGLSGSGNPYLAGAGAILSGLTGKADGGPVSPSKPYIVGERGPELFVPVSAGTIVPGGAGGQINIYQRNTFNGTTNVAEMQRMLRQTREQTKAEVFEQLRRGKR